MKIDREFCQERLVVNLIGILVAVLLFWGACYVFYSGTVNIFIEGHDYSKQFKESQRKVEMDLRKHPGYAGTWDEDVALSQDEIDRLLRMGTK